MKKNNIVIAAMIAVVLLIVVLAAVHLATRENVPEGQLSITYQDERRNVVFGDLPLQQVKGTISNAKGDKREIEAQGISVKNLLSAAGIESFSRVTVVAEDEYRAEVTAEEIAAECVVCMILQEDGGIQMIVFTDANSKRNVSNVVRMEVS